MQREADLSNPPRLAKVRTKVNRILFFHVRPQTSRAQTGAACQFNLIA